MTTAACAVRRVGAIFLRTAPYAHGPPPSPTPLNQQQQQPQMDGPSAKRRLVPVDDTDEKKQEQAKQGQSHSVAAAGTVFAQILLGTQESCSGDSADQDTMVDCSGGGDAAAGVVACGTKTGREETVANEKGTAVDGSTKNETRVVLFPSLNDAPHVVDAPAAVAGVYLGAGTGVSEVLLVNGHGSDIAAAAGTERLEMPSKVATMETVVVGHQGGSADVPMSDASEARPGAAGVDGPLVEGTQCMTGEGPTAGEKEGEVESVGVLQLEKGGNSTKSLTVAPVATALPTDSTPKAMPLGAMSSDAPVMARPAKVVTAEVGQVMAPAPASLLEALIGNGEGAGVMGGGVGKNTPALQGETQIDGETVASPEAPKPDESAAKAKADAVTEAVAIAETAKAEAEAVAAAAAAAAATAKAKTQEEEKEKAKKADEQQAAATQAKRECAEACARLLEARGRVCSGTRGWSVEQLVALRGSMLELGAALCGRAKPGGAAKTAGQAVVTLLRYAEHRVSQG